MFHYFPGFLLTNTPVSTRCWRKYGTWSTEAGRAGDTHTRRCEFCGTRCSSRPPARAATSGRSACSSPTVDRPTRTAPCGKRRPPGTPELLWSPLALATGWTNRSSLRSPVIRMTGITFTSGMFLPLTTLLNLCDRLFAMVRKLIGPVVVHTQGKVNIKWQIAFNQLYASYPRFGLYLIGIFRPHSTRIYLVSSLLTIYCITGWFGVVFNLAFFWQMPVNAKIKIT